MSDVLLFTQLVIMHSNPVLSILGSGKSELEMSADHCKAVNQSKKVLAFCLSDSLNNFPAILKHIAQVTVLSKRSHKMLTWSKKRRTTGKDKSCPQNSNQKHSPIPVNHAVEAGEMVTMEHCGTSGGLHDDGQRTDYLQVAWLLREKLNDLLDGDEGESPKLGLRSLLDMAASRNIVSVDHEMLNPVLWRTLPKELLLHVFARLPVPDITRLRCLSREWRRDLGIVNSEINQSCDEASPSMIALLSNSSTHAFLVTIFDIAKCRWQSPYHLHLRGPRTGDSETWLQTWTAVACDDGLMCFISLWIPTKLNPLCIVVVNLLTRVQHELPPLHYRYCKLPAMVQIKVDSRTKCYQVVMAGYQRGSLAIETYDSGARQWTRGRSSCGFISGPVHNWSTFTFPGWCFRLSTPTPGVYDFAEGKLVLHPSVGKSGSDRALLDLVFAKDRLFVLEEQMQMDASLRRKVRQGFCITEHHFENEAKDWVQGKSYECPVSFEELRVEEISDMCLYACDGFLVVVFQYYQMSQYIRLLDLSTSEWSTPSKFKLRRVACAEACTLQGSLECCSLSRSS